MFKHSTQKNSNGPSIDPSGTPSGWCHYSSGVRREHCTHLNVVQSFFQCSIVIAFPHYICSIVTEVLPIFVEHWTLRKLVRWYNYWKKKSRNHAIYLYRVISFVIIYNKNQMRNPRGIIRSVLHSRHIYYTSPF